MMKKTLLLAIAVLAISIPAFAANVLVNGDFQTGTVGVTDPIGTIPGWTTFKLASNGTDQTSFKGGLSSTTVTDGLTADTMAPINGTLDLYMSLRGGDTNGAVSGIYQILNLEPGQYTLDGYVSALNSKVPATVDGYVLWQVGIIQGDWTAAPVYGASGGRAPEYGSGIWGGKFDRYGSSNADTNGAIRLSTRSVMGGSNVLNVTTPGAYTVYVMMGVNCDPQNTDKRRFKMRVDNLTLDQQQVVPEPASFFALGTGLMGLAGAIRRKQR